MTSPITIRSLVVVFEYGGKTYNATVGGDRRVIAAHRLDPHGTRFPSVTPVPLDPDADAEVLRAITDQLCWPMHPPALPVPATPTAAPKAPPL